MPKDIKTHTTQQGTIKTFNSTVKTFERTVREGRDIKTAYNQADADHSPDNAPADILQYGAERTAVKGIPKVLGKTARTTRSSAKATLQIKERTAIAKESIKEIKPAIKTVGSTAKNGMHSIQSTIKTAQNTVKAANTAVKTGTTVAKTSAKTARATYEGAKATAKATAEAVKITAKATVEAIKITATAIKAGAEALASFISAGGWIAVAVIAVVVIIAAVFGIVLSSPHGIFFSGEDTGNGMTMPIVISSINEDYETELDKVINQTPHDIIEMTGSRAVWSDVLSVYAVKAIGDGNQEIITMDEDKKAFLSEIFWEMNEISSRTEKKTETQIIESDDGHGNIVEKEETVTQTYLFITVSHKSAEEMADKYGFNKEERSELFELLSPENRELWSQALYGVSSGDGNIVSTALSQVGNVGGEPYWRWYGFDARVDWCACFISWCADQCGYIESGIIPKFAGCTNGSNWFKSRGLWQDNNYEPRPGDIIFFDWNSDNGQDGLPDHVGIVEKVENGKVYTVEGNAGDVCRQKKYSLGYYEIYGYGVPAY